MRHELPTPAEMGEIDSRAIAAGPLDGPSLMENAGRAIYREILARFPQATHHAVLCGPGNNGGDGYVVARLLAESGLAVSVFNEGPPRAGSDAERAAARCHIAPLPLDAFAPKPGWLVVDALYGAGFARALSHNARCAARLTNEAGAMVMAVDVPSGLDGATGRLDEGAFRADLTVTFVRRKPGHLLEPGRSACGRLVVADIGIPDRIVAEVASATFENRPSLWHATLPRPATDTHKYRRGHCAVFSGGPSATGAARLAAAAAARAGAGAVTVLAGKEAVAANAAHLTAVMVREAAGMDDVLAFLADRKVASFVFGPGLGRRPKVASFLLELLEKAPAGVAAVVDADGISVLEGRHADLAAALRARLRPLVLTPHDGEFARLFPELAGDDTLSKLDRAKRAAELVGGVVVLKGSDSVIAAPDGRAAINANGAPWLATAGSGDVLAGLVGGLLAQGMPAWEAACAAVWTHAEAGAQAGAGLVADDLPAALVPVLRGLA
ncbi:MAG: NAD(P)H-hydrate dehydratase [Rhizobiaceae bacterium]|nr:NAD(P)H-hydrate dehydratase [Rhizobiaceae bacterium]